MNNLSLRRLFYARDTPLSKAQRFGIGAGIIAAFCLVYGIVAVRLVVNASTSMPHNAYLMVTWPQVITRGSIVAAKLPPVLEMRVEGMVLVKKVAGITGDPVHRNGREICIFRTCLTGVSAPSGHPLPLWSVDSVPDDQLAVVGESTTSLDSRYEAIGGIDRGDIVAVGFPIRFPHWSELGLGTSRRMP